MTKWSPLKCILISLMMFSFCCSVMAEPNCRPVLWPAASVLSEPFMRIPQPIIANMQQSADKILNQPSHTSQRLGHESKISLQHPQLTESKERVKDADKAALLALTYYLTHQEKYLKKTRDILMSWSKHQHLTGNPADEDRLESMIWAYDLISCQLSKQDNKAIKKWFNQIRIKKLAWKFDAATPFDTYRIHQYKMLLLLDKVLQRRADLQKDMINLEKFSKINLNMQAAATENYLEKNALYYYNYRLLPWLEITLISGCCRQPVQRGFQLLPKQILSDHMINKSAYTTSNIHTILADNDSDDAQKERRGDAAKAPPLIVMYYTLDPTNSDEQLWTIHMQTKPV